MNEFQLSIGESTCASRFYGIPKNTPGYDGKAGIEVNEMSRYVYKIGDDLCWVD